MEDHGSTRQLKRAELTEASTPTMSKRPRPDVLEGESSEKINVPSASGVDSDPSASSTSVIADDYYTSVIGNNYYVFLSFRGPDTRKGFVDHLYHKLVDVGLHHPNFVFRDDEKLRFGEPIADNLLAAIKRSKVSIPVISEDYAASEWCLKELIQIMECREKTGQIVLPVLYKVKTDDVKFMRGKFGDAFRRKHRSDKEFKKAAKAALQKALELRVYKSEEDFSGREAELVKELVETILREQQRDFQPHLPGNLVGIEDRVAEVMKWVDIACPDTQIIGIWGMGGIGKTTLATNIYNKLFDEFECRSFLKDTRETIKSKGMEHVQSLLISDITKNPESRVRDSETGIRMIRSSCEKKKVLILLDDVDHRDHLDNLIEGCNFKLGSRIIITSRDKALLKSEYKKYELKEMHRKDSLLLFSRYAFQEEQPPTEFAALSGDIVATTGGLPLALIVIGSLLNEVKDQVVWREMLIKLKSAPDETVQEKLRISYDTLKYEEKQMFLDIACFFSGTDMRIATYLWEDLKFFPRIRLQVLINRSLIKIDDKNQLRMHDQLRDLGRAVACPADKKPWDCSRLWDKEAITVLRRKEENGNIEALCLDKNGSSMFMEGESFKRMPYLKFLHLREVDFVGDFEDSLSELRWLEWKRCPDSFEATNVHLEKLLVLDLSGGFISEKWEGWNSIKMEKLKVLNLSKCSHLKSTPNLSALKSLERLILENCANLEEIDPSIGDVKCLVSLNLTSCRSLKNLPAHLGELKCLVSLNLRFCRSLKNLPAQLGELRALEELIVDLTDIQEFPECIGSLQKLKMLSAKNCIELTRVPAQLGELKCLVSLNLWACQKLKELPGDISKLEELKEINIGSTAIKEIPPSIDSLKKLEMIDARDCQSLVGLPDSISHLVNLSTLDLRDCFNLHHLPDCMGSLVKLQRLSLGLVAYSNDMDDAREVYCLLGIPDSIGKLEWLTELDLSYTGNCELPDSIGNLKNLKILNIAHSKKLRNLPSTISKLGKLEVLDASCCESLGGKITIDGMSSLRILQLSWTSVSGFHDAIDKLSHLETLDLTGCEKLESLPQSINKLPSLQHLKLTLCKKLQTLPELPACLTVLKVTCKHVTLPQLSHLSNIKEITVENCTLLESMPELPLGILKVHIERCDKFKELPSLSSLGSLLELNIHGCDELTVFEGLKALKSLAKLYVFGCPKLSNLDGLEHLQSLRHLEMSIVHGSPLLNQELVLDLHRLNKLEDLVIWNCHSLMRLDLSQLTHLKRLDTFGCSNIVEIKGLEGLKNLESLDIRRCTSIETLPERSCFGNLHTYYHDSEAS